MVPHRRMLSGESRSIRAWIDPRFSRLVFGFVVGPWRDRPRAHRQPPRLAVSVPTRPARGRVGSAQRTKTIDVTVRVPALEKLVDYGASGVGAVAGPMLANWRASREGAARLTSARIDAEVRRPEAKSNSESLRIIADAQAIARQSIDTTSESEYSMVEITRNDIVRIPMK